MKVLGAILLIACGSCTGFCVSAAYRRKTALLESIADMLLSFLIKIEYGAPTVRDMFAEVKEEKAELPSFMADAYDGVSAAEALKKYPDGLTKQDAAKLSELFLQLGSADKASELQRLQGARAYFLQRTGSERPENEKKAQLAQKLGILFGIFAAVMLI